MLFLFRAPFPSSAELAKSPAACGGSDFASSLRWGLRRYPLRGPVIHSLIVAVLFAFCVHSPPFSSIHPSPSSVFFPSHISQLPNPIHILYKSYTTPLHILYSSYTNPTQLIYNSYTNPKQQLDTSYINPTQAPHISYTAEHSLA